VDGVSAAWPTARLDPIAKLRVLEASLPGAVMQERLISEPFDAVWGFVSDLETSVPAFDREVSRVRIVREHGDELRIHTWATGVPVPLAFDVILRDDSMWMVSRPRLYVVGMAAIPEGRQTRLGHLEGFTKGARLSRVVRRRQRRHVARDLDGIERCLAARRRGEPSG
jgi:hypothetical protein